MLSLSQCVLFLRSLMVPRSSHIRALFCHVHVKYDISIPGPSSHQNSANQRSTLPYDVIDSFPKSSVTKAASNSPSLVAPATSIYMGRARQSVKNAYALANRGSWQVISVCRSFRLKLLSLLPFFLSDLSVVSIFLDLFLPSFSSFFILSLFKKSIMIALIFLLSAFSVGVSFPIRPSVPSTSVSSILGGDDSFLKIKCHEPQIFATRSAICEEFLKRTATTPSITTTTASTKITCTTIAGWAKALISLASLLVSAYAASVSFLKFKLKYCLKSSLLLGLSGRDHFRTSAPELPIQTSTI